QVAIASGPGRMGLGVDVEGERVPLLTIGRVGFELGAVRHRHLDAMIVGMKIILLLHDHLTPTAAAANSAKSCGLSTGNAPVGQGPGRFRIALARRRKRLRHHARVRAPRVFRMQPPHFLLRRGRAPVLGLLRRPRMPQVTGPEGSRFHRCFARCEGGEVGARRRVLACGFGSGHGAQVTATIGSGLAGLAVLAALASAPAAVAQDASNWMKWPGPAGAQANDDPTDREFIREWEATPPRGYPTLSPNNVIPIKAAIIRYSQIAAGGGWTSLSESQLQQGSTGSAVASLKQHLVLTGDLSDRGGNPESFDFALVKAVRRY